MFKWLAGMLSLAHIKTHAIEVSEKQFPEIYRPARKFADSLGQPLPPIYIMQDSTWNAFAARLAMRRQVVVFSGAVDSLLLKGSPKHLAWVVGHELGHHYAGHLNFWRLIASCLGSWFIWVGLWYRRCCELTCDRYGLACAGSLEDSMRAVCNMAAGAQLAGEADIREAIAQWKKHSSEFFVMYRAFYSAYPPTLARLEELEKSAGQLGIS